MQFEGDRAFKSGSTSRATACQACTMVSEVAVVSNRRECEHSASMSIMAHDYVLSGKLRHVLSSSISLIIFGKYMPAHADHQRTRGNPAKIKT